MDVAANHLTADLEERRGPMWKRALAWLWALVEAAFGMGAHGPMDLVIRRIDNGREVMRTAADSGSPDFLLEQVREDLETKTVDEFFAEWRLE
ncbi:hypothetical protein FVA74_01870 [Salinibacterium sp. dk2585]|uniref:hypothetical protein n=1 Tax=unclassified Salinibacterium TaxID=2632331 RepID=UPI0011C25291|nr:MULTISPECIES: hypothetical protein [unclassified Salinibacterium]QEE60455.1 hypothetical protein FVA74_01870 [Salinibacterium sp. dk2585]TXK55528.1 hypothetical protein FVP63_02015 [Salinibacterium sp. dk5596]